MSAHLSLVPDGLNMNDPDDQRLALNVCRETCLECAATLAEAVRQATDDPRLYQLADAVVSSLRLERRIRRLLAAEVAG